MKKTTIILFVLTISLLMILPTQAANSPSLDGVQIFPKDNIWNTRIDALPIDEHTDIYINNLVTDSAPYTGLRHYIRDAIPYNVVNSSQPHYFLTSFNHNGIYSDTVAYPIPENPLFEQGSNDHHMVIIDVDEMVLYELFAAQKTADGTWRAGLGAVWDLRGYGFRKNNVTPMWSADESGLPIFPGLVRYDEVSSGYINHSLRMGVPVLQNSWVWPARASAPLPSPYNPANPPAGQRFRLKESYDISGFPPQAKVILQALKTYGAMATTLNGKGNPVTIIGSPDTRWNETDLNTLRRVNISDFEAVNVSSLMIDKNSSQARQLPEPTPKRPLLTPSPKPIHTTAAHPTNALSPENMIIAGIGIFAILFTVRSLKK